MRRAGSFGAKAESCNRGSCKIAIQVSGNCWAVERITVAVGLSIDMQKQLRARQRLGDAVDGTRIAIDRGDYRPAIRRAPFRSTRYSEQIELTRAAEWLELWPEGA